MKKIFQDFYTIGRKFIIMENRLFIQSLENKTDYKEYKLCFDTDKIYDIKVIYNAGLKILNLIINLKNDKWYLVVVNDIIEDIFEQTVISTKPINLDNIVSIEYDIYYLDEDECKGYIIKDGKLKPLRNDESYIDFIGYHSVKFGCTTELTGANGFANYRPVVRLTNGKIVGLKNFMKI